MDHQTIKSNPSFSPRRRIEMVFDGRKPDGMVWFGDLTYWHGAHEQIGDLPEPWRGAEGQSRMHRELGVGEHIPGCCAFDLREGDEVKVVENLSGQLH